MKLIDVDALDVVGTIIPSDADTKSYVMGMEYILNKIDKMPTIEERKTGKWEMLNIPMAPSPHKCSVCGMPALCYMTGCLVNRHLEEELTNFCPNCGAKMEGEEDGRNDTDT